MASGLHRLTTGLAALALAVSAATTLLAQNPALAPGSYKPPHTIFGHPDLNGFWQSLNGANWDIEDHGAQTAPYANLVGVYLAQPPGLGVVEGGTIPYKPEALAKKKRFFENRLKTDPLLADNVSEDLADPEAKCFQGGVPRATYMPFPFQVIQSKDQVLVAYQFGGQSARVVHIGDDFAKTRAAKLLDINSWMGQSVGRYEGDTLVVETRGFSGTVWLDRAGNYMSDQAVVVERYTPMSPYHLMYEATITDPTVFTKPWKIRMPLYKRVDANAELIGFECIPLAEEFMYGSLYRKTTK